MSQYKIIKMLAYVNKAKLNPFLISVALLFTFSCNAQDYSENIVAKVGSDDYEISFSKLNKFHADNFYEQRFPKSSSKGYGEALDKMILDRLKLLDFFAQKMHEDKELLQPLQRIISEEIVYQYFKTQYLSQYINEESIREYYNGMGKEFSYRQIVLRKPQGGGIEQLERVKKKVDEIIQLALENRDFEKLVSEYSEDRYSAARGGLTNPVSWNRNSSRPVFNQLYMLNKGDVKTLETGDAYYIIKIKKIEQVASEPLEKVRSKIITELEKIYGLQSVQDFDREKENIIDKATFEWNDSGLNTLLKWAEGKTFSRSEYVQMLKRRVSPGDNFMILKHVNGMVDAEDYIRLVSEVLFPEGPGSMKPKNLKNFIEEAVRTDLIVKKAKEAGLEKKVLNPDSPSDVLRQLLVRMYDQEMIDSKVPEPTKEQIQQFYELNKEELFYQLAKVSTYVKIFDDKESAELMMAEIEGGKTFEDAADRRYLVKTFIITRQGEIETYLSTEEPYLGKTAFELETGEIMGPIEISISEKGQQFVIIKCTNKLPEKQLDLTEVNNIEEEFKKYHRGKIKQSIENGLKEKYPVTIFSEILKEKIQN